MKIESLPGYGPGEELPSGPERVATAEHLIAQGYRSVLGANIMNGHHQHDAVTKEILDDIRGPQHGIIGPYVLIVPDKVLPDGNINPGEVFAPAGAALWQREEQ